MMLFINVRKREICFLEGLMEYYFLEKRNGMINERSSKSIIYTFILIGT